MLGAPSFVRLLHKEPALSLPKGWETGWKQSRRKMH
jgi:hypothetical protein